MWNNSLEEELSNTIDKLMLNPAKDSSSRFENACKLNNEIIKLLALDGKIDYAQK